MSDVPQLSRRLRTKAGFLWFSVVVVGSGSALLLLWNFGGHEQPGSWLFLVGIGLGSGWLWGFLMWHLWIAPNFHRQEKDG